MGEGQDGGAPGPVRTDYETYASPA